MALNQRSTSQDNRKRDRSSEKKWRHKSLCEQSKWEELAWLVKNGGKDRAVELKAVVDEFVRGPEAKKLFPPKPLGNALIEDGSHFPDTVNATYRLLEKGAMDYVKNEVEDYRTIIPVPLDRRHRPLPGRLPRFENGELRTTRRIELPDDASSEEERTLNWARLGSHLIDLWLIDSDLGQSIAAAWADDHSEDDEFHYGAIFEVRWRLQIGHLGLHDDGIRLHFYQNAPPKPPLGTPIIPGGELPGMQDRRRRLP